MDYEKKYKEALALARSYYDKDSMNAFLDTIFQELRESEDERIREWLVDYFTEIGENWIHSEFTCKQIVAYLEKQKEQKHPDGCFTCDEYKKGYEAGRLNGFTAGYNKAMKEQKPAEWSEEDDQLIGFIFDLLNDLVWRKDFAMSKEECLERLKSISPVKQEWSEEDEATYNAFICEVVNEKMNPTVEQVKWLRDIRDRLKSLRSSWRPSEEQMEALERASTNEYLSAKQFDILVSLYEQLKAL